MFSDTCKMEHTTHIRIVVKGRLLVLVITYCINVKNIFALIYSLTLHPELGLSKLTKRFYHIQLINTL